MLLTCYVQHDSSGRLDTHETAYFSICTRLRQFGWPMFVAVGARVVIVTCIRGRSASNQNYGSPEQG